MEYMEKVWLSRTDGPSWTEWLDSFGKYRWQLVFVREQGPSGIRWMQRSCTFMRKRRNHATV